MDQARRHIRFRRIIDGLHDEGSDRGQRRRSPAGIQFVYAAQIGSGELKINDESKEAAWVPLSSAVHLPLAESQRRRLKDVIEYQKERHQTFLR